MLRLIFSAVCVVLAGSSLRAEEQDSGQSSPRPAEVNGIRNVHVSENIMLAGQPTQEALAELAKQGFSTVITLRHEGEERFDEKQTCEKLGLKFVRLPINSPSEMDDELIRTVCNLLKEAKPDAKVLCHCAGANRVGAVWIPYRVELCDVPLESAREEAAKVGLKTKELEEQALKYLAQ